MPWTTASECGSAEELGDRRRRSFRRRAALLGVVAAAAAMALPAGGANAEVKNHTIYLNATFHLPAGTNVKFRLMGSVCALHPLHGAGAHFTIGHNGETQLLRLYTADAGGSIFHACAYKKSDAQFDVTIEAPDGDRRFAYINAIQVNDPNAFEIKYLNHCYHGNLPCTSGTDAIQIVTGGRAITLPGSFGPIPLGPAGATYCAAESENCSFSGTKQVAFGRDGHYTRKTVTGGTPCTTAAFGSDPVLGKHKACWIS
jgi:hypothetical protein